jgi:hypothetical protein
MFQIEIIDLEDVANVMLDSVRICPAYSQNAVSR